MGKWLSKRWRIWVNRRIPRSDRRRFTQKTIFILPTGAGWVFALLLLVMLVTGINYQNSLIYLLTFFLGTVFVAAMHQTHQNLAGLELTLVGAGEGFAGESVPFYLRAVSDKHDALAIALTCQGVQLGRQHIRSGEPLDLSLLVPSRYRGYLLPERIRVETRFPFGLLKAWSWLRPETPALVYPRPLEAPQMAGAEAGGETAEQVLPAIGSDHADIRPWREGDLSQRVLWKRYARTGEMVVADWQGQASDPHWLDYDAFPGVERELRLSYLAAAALARSRDNRPFGLRLPGKLIDTDSGPAQATRCLRALARFGLARPGEGRV